MLCVAALVELVTKVMPGQYSHIEMLTNEHSSCYHKSFGDCRKLVNDGYAQCGGNYKCEYEIQEKLQVVEIYFDTPTFDKITIDAKTNSIAKLSMIGGTLGLLTGK